MFGVSFSELVVIAVVALVVVGPRRLPEILGTLGKWVRKVRTMTTEVRRQTGIDEILREEGIAGGLAELRSIVRTPGLANLGNLASIGSIGAGNFGPGANALVRSDSAVNEHGEAVDYDRYREYPTEGPDGYGCIPEDLLPSPAAETPVLPSPAPPTETTPTKEAE
ncbi:MAG TPA: Sec-independent protein translocase protein TatB [Polyangiaceae bacterium]|nr:Sec-independent protein translocase protein TatB [Polyangiaceae bacterium]